MSKALSIPLLRTSTFGPSYFEGTTPAVPTSANHYFEIRRRCGYQDVIKAHRLDFYLVFMITQGEGLYTFGTQEYYVRENMLCFVGPEVVNSWAAAGGEQQGYFCAFSADFFSLGSENKNYLLELPLFQLLGTAVLDLTAEQTRFFRAQFELLHGEYEVRDAHSGPVLRSMLQALVHKAHSQYLAEARCALAPNHGGIRLLKAFTALYQRDFSVLAAGQSVQLKTVASYAAELGVSQNHLNDTIKALTGVSAGQHIKKQLLEHAAMCLKTSDKSIGEIAYLLGFSDPSYFARYYKRRTGQAPSSFR
jgi:AraC family transcriptional activator of pobA